MIATLILPTDRSLLLPDLRAVRRTRLACISRPKELLRLRVSPGDSRLHPSSPIGKSIICLPLRRYCRSGHADTRPGQSGSREAGSLRGAQRRRAWPPKEAAPTLLFACRDGILRVSEPEDQTTEGLRRLGSSPCRC